MPSRDGPRPAKPAGFPRVYIEHRRQQVCGDLGNQTLALAVQRRSLMLATQQGDERLVQVISDVPGRLTRRHPTRRPIITRGYRMRRTTLIVLVSVALLPVTSRVTAAQPPNKQARERLAKKACLAGDPGKGVEILADLYVETDDITYLFNQGRCFEQNRRYEDAVARFREYLMKGESTLSEGDKAAANKHIESCESYMPKPEPRSPLVPESVSAATVAPPPRAAEDAPETPTVVATAPATPADKNTRAGLRIAGIVVAAVGVASLTTAVLFNLKANRMADDLNKPEGYDQDKVSQRNTNETLSWAGYGVGAACLVGGAILLYFGYRGHNSPRMALAPSIAPDQIGLSFQGGF